MRWLPRNVKFLLVCKDWLCQKALLATYSRGFLSSSDPISAKDMLRERLLSWQASAILDLLRKYKTRIEYHSERVSPDERDLCLLFEALKTPRLGDVGMIDERIFDLFELMISSGADEQWRDALVTKGFVCAVVNFPSVMGRFEQRMIKLRAKITDKTAISAGCKQQSASLCRTRAD